MWCLCGALDDNRTGRREEDQGTRARKLQGTSEQLRRSTTAPGTRLCSWIPSRGQRKPTGTPERWRSSSRWCLPAWGPGRAALGLPCRKDEEAIGGGDAPSQSPQSPRTPQAHTQSSGTAPLCVLHDTGQQTCPSLIHPHLPSLSPPTAGAPREQDRIVTTVHVPSPSGTAWTQQALRRHLPSE